MKLCWDRVIWAAESHMRIKLAIRHAQPVADNMILCPQCDLLMALPPLSTGTKALCSRCSTILITRWEEPYKRSIGYALSALFMLLLANIFPFITMRVAGFSNEIKLINIPQVMLEENYASMATLFMLLVQLIPALCMLVIILLCSKVRMPLVLKEWMAKMLFQFKAWCMVEIFLAGCWSVCQANGLWRYWHRQQLCALLPVLSVASTHFSVHRPPLALAGDRTGTALESSVDDRTYRHESGPALMSLLHGNPAC